MKAYFTVEAACIMPLMLGIYVFLIFTIFYRYDRCLLEQDAGLMAIEESAQLSGRSADRYLAFRWSGRSMERGLRKVKAEVSGSVKIPFAQILTWTSGSSWELSASFEKWEIDPPGWIRLYRKIRKGAENAADGVY